MTFDCLALRFHFRAKQSIRFPDPAANLIRGALGFELDSSLFAPTVATGPSGLRNRPRPFVLRASELDGRSIQAGEEFDFGVNVFCPGDALAAAFESALGGRAELVSSASERIVVSLLPDPNPVRRITVRFLTPTELKSEGGVVERPEFPVLFARIRERLIALRTFYGPGPVKLDWPAHAAEIRMTRCDIAWRKAERRSTRTGQRHPLGGFTGEADYEGDLAAFLPFLRAAYWTGVGRQTVWGKGVIDTR
ncbi:MAG: CRISPR system precrRNA processing endoribonuclease RAMP protein Cas6 [Acidobacteria bacterium]|nr:CRISPR system precrRNA processing endoribonuclease RAMP protein Cas6 [Acidobacteriota bacterium]